MTDSVQIINQQTSSIDIIDADNYAIYINDSTPTSIEVSLASIGPQGLKGDTGATGPANDLSIGTVQSGSSAAATITGTSPTQVLNLVLPTGAQGATGATGAAGSAATVAVGTVTTGSAGSSASVSNAGSSSAAVFNFTIPRGDVGATGATGAQGATGSAATISVGTVTTGAAGSSASVTNSGSSSAAVFNFNIPQGAVGATGATGATGTAATISIGTVTTGAAGSAATVTNVGSSSAAVFNFSIPKGADGIGSGTVTSVSALTIGTTGTDISSSVVNGTSTPVISLNIPTASATNRGALSASDWATFNSKQNALGFTPYNATNPSGYISSITSGMVTTALGYTPLNPTTSQTAAYVYAAPSGTAGAPTFRALAASDIPTLNQNTTGTAASITGVYAGTLTSSQITTGLGFTPYNSTNPNSYTTLAAVAAVGYLTGITGTQVTTALGFTPYNATNPSGFTSNVGTVTSVSALTLGTSGTDVSSSVATGTTTPIITLNIPTASATNRGALSSTDWIAFNSKGSGTVTSVSAITLGTTGTDLSSSIATGTTTPVITLNVPTASATNRGALSAADWTTFNNKQPAGSYLTSVTADAPLSGLGTSGSHLVIATANTTTTGAISSTDWNTFNSKQSALISGTNIKTVGGVSLLGLGDVGIIGGTYGGTGVNNGSNTITIAGNVTHLGSFSQTFTATGNTTVTLPTIGTLATLAGTETFTNKRVTPRTTTTTSSATPTINSDTTDIFGLTAQAVDITSFSTNLSGTPTDGQKLWIYIAGTAARAITWGASFESSIATLPSTTVSTNRLDIGFVWNTATSKWRCVAVA